MTFSSTFWTLTSSCFSSKVIISCSSFFSSISLLFISFVCSAIISSTIALASSWISSTCCKFLDSSILLTWILFASFSSLIISIFSSKLLFSVASENSTLASNGSIFNSSIFISWIGWNSSTSTYSIGSISSTWISSINGNTIASSSMFVVLCSKSSVTSFLSTLIILVQHLFLKSLFIFANLVSSVSISLIDRSNFSIFVLYDKHCLSWILSSLWAFSESCGILPNLS